MMKPIWLGVALALVGCGKHGEHQSVVYIEEGRVTARGSGDTVDDGMKLLSPAAVDLMQTELTAKLTTAGFKSCTWAKPRSLQLGAHPIAWFCGTLGGTSVEASINRPGMNQSPLELDLRADVSGSPSKITTQEAPVIAYRDGVVTWLRANVERWWALDHTGRNGCCPGVGTSGAILGE
jgi:hypothetical protein